MVSATQCATARTIWACMHPPISTPDAHIMEALTNLRAQQAVLILGPSSAPVHNCCYVNTAQAWPLCSLTAAQTQNAVKNSKISKINPLPHCCCCHCSTLAVSLKGWRSWTDSCVARSPRTPLRRVCSSCNKSCNSWSIKHRHRCSSCCLLLR